MKRKRPIDRIVSASMADDYENAYTPQEAAQITLARIKRMEARLRKERKLTEIITDKGVWQATDSRIEEVKECIASHGYKIIAIRKIQ